MLLSRLFLAFLIAVVSTTISFANVSGKIESNIEQADEDIITEDEELAD